MKEHDQFICSCGAHEHQINFWYERDYNSVYVYMHLARYGFFKRLWFGIRYILGVKSRHGEFPEIIIDHNDSQRLIDFLNQQISISEIKDTDISDEG